MPHVYARGTLSPSVFATMCQHAIRKLLNQPRLDQKASDIVMHRSWLVLQRMFSLRLYATSVDVRDVTRPASRGKMSLR